MRVLDHHKQLEIDVKSVRTELRKSIANLQKPNQRANCGLICWKEAIRLGSLDRKLMNIEERAKSIRKHIEKVIHKESFLLKKELQMIDRGL